jgi:hypothetical protein
MENWREEQQREKEEGTSPSLCLMTGGEGAKVVGLLGPRIQNRDGRS